MSKRERGRQRRRAHRWARKLALVGLASIWLGVLGLALPLVAHGDTSLLASYGASASGWAIQPYILNDAFLNIPAADQSSPYLFVAIDNTPSAEAKASYFTPGTAINAVLTTENTGQQVPSGVDARYPGNGTASSQVGPVSDGVATQAGAASESAQAAEAYAQAQAGLASYQFAPAPGSVPPGGGGGPLPTVPPVPTLPPIGSTPTPPPGGHPTPTPTPPSGHPAPTPTPCPLGICLGMPLQVGGNVGNAAIGQGTYAQPATVKLPDLFEQRLAAALKTMELANPQLLQLAGGHLATPNSQLPYAAADESGEAIAQASNSGVTLAVTVHAGHVELFQGLITFATIDSTLQGLAPASNAPGQGKITTTITNAQIAGIPVTIDQNGVQVNGVGGSQSSALEQQLSAALSAALQQAGIKINLTKSTSIQDTGKWQGSGGGLEVASDFEPGNGVPGTHVDFTLGEVSGSAYALPGAPFNSGSGFGSGYFGGGGFGGFGGSPSGGSGGSNNQPQNPASRLLSLLGSLSPGELLSLLFIVQGVSTAAVAAAAGGAETAAKAGKLLVEEESQ